MMSRSTSRSGHVSFLIGSTLQIMAGVAISGVVLAAARVVIGRVLGPVGLGETAALWSLSAVLGALPIAGVTPMLARFGATYLHDARSAELKGLLITAYSWSLGLCFAVAAAALAARGWIAEHWLGMPHLETQVAVACIALPAWCLLHLSVATFRAHGETLPSVALQDVSRPLLLGVAILGLAWAGALTTASVTTVFVLTLVVVGFVAFWLSIRKFQGVLRVTARHAWGEWFRYSYPLSLSMVMQTIAGTSIDVLLIAALTDSGETGKYVCAATLARFAALIIQAVNYPALPFFSAGGRSREQAAILDSRRVTFHLGLPSIMVLLCWPSLLARITFGEQFVSAAPAIQVLAFGVMVQIFFGPLGQLLLAESRTKAHLLADVVSIAAFFGIGLLSIRHLGGLGAALARSASMIVFQLVALGRLLTLSRPVTGTQGMLSPALLICLPILATRAMAPGLAQGWTMVLAATGVGLSVLVLAFHYGLFSTILGKARARAATQ